METNNKGSRKLLLQKQQISNADLADVYGGAENTGGQWSGAISAITSGIVGGFGAAFVSASSSVTVAGVTGSIAASKAGSEAISDTFGMGHGEAIGRSLVELARQRRQLQKQK
jgi:hypothetical protein